MKLGAIALHFIFSFNPKLGNINKSCPKHYAGQLLLIIGRACSLSPSTHGTAAHCLVSFAMVNSIPQKWGKPWQSVGRKFPNIILKPSSSSIR